PRTSRIHHYPLTSAVAIRDRRVMGIAAVGSIPLISPRDRSAAGQRETGRRRIRSVPVHANRLNIDDSTARRDEDERDRPSRELPPERAAASVNVGEPVPSVTATGLGVVVNATAARARPGNANSHAPATRPVASPNLLIASSVTPLIGSVAN